MKVVSVILSAATVSVLSFSLFSKTEIAAAYEPITALIPISCNDMLDQSQHIYEIKIDTTDPGFPLPVTDTLLIPEHGTGSFEINVSEPGSYIYRIYEEPGNDETVIYDDNVYYVTVYVEINEEEELSYAVVANTDGMETKPDEIVFANGLIADRTNVRTDVNIDEPVSVTTYITTVTDSPSASGEGTAQGGSSSSGGSGGSGGVSGRTSTDDSTPSLKKVLDSVLTGDKFPAHAVRTILFLSVLVGLFAFLSKRKKEEGGEAYDEEV